MWLAGTKSAAAFWTCGIATLGFAAGGLFSICNDLMKIWNAYKTVKNNDENSIALAGHRIETAGKLGISVILAFFLPLAMGATTLTLASMALYGMVSLLSAMFYKFDHHAVRIEKSNDGDNENPLVEKQTLKGRFVCPVWEMYLQHKHLDI
ncbi:MAG: hypothetical protein COB50_04430 [Thiotrichales bacterium]|nr:MAG: hypothetical protein COB50_04430 [Thiotrichales bacterium]